MIGSSLLAVPSISCDQAFVKAKGPYASLPNMFDFTHYKRCDYFKMLLSNSFGKKVDVVNLGIAGIVTSDESMVIEKALAFKKKPSLIVWTIAPAEFIWNDGHGVNGTRIGTAFKSYLWPMDVSAPMLTVDHVRRECAWHFDLLENELAACKTPLTEMLCKWLNRPDANTNKPAGPETGDEETANLSTATGEQEVSNLSTAMGEHELSDLPTEMDAYGRRNRLEDIANFKKNYAKIDSKLFDTQLDYFNKTLSVCKENDVPVVIVNMPLTKYNRELINKSTYSKYLSSVTKICAKQMTPFIDMDRSTEFSLSDFYDSTHLNEEGGRKLFTALADRIPKIGSSQTSVAGVSTTPN